MTPRAFLFGTGETSRATDLGLLALRLGVGITIAFAYGLGKVPPSQGFVAGVDEMGFPIPAAFAWAAGLSEFVGGLCIALGLGTRPAALMLAITMAVAAFIRHQGDLLGEAGGAWIYFVCAVALLFAGAGRYAIDPWLAPKE